MASREGMAGTHPGYHAHPLPAFFLSLRDYLEQPMHCSFARPGGARIASGGTTVYEILVELSLAAAFVGCIGLFFRSV